MLDAFLVTNDGIDSISKKVLNGLMHKESLQKRQLGFSFACNFKNGIS